MTKVKEEAIKQLYSCSSRTLDPKVLRDLLAQAQ